MAEKLVVTPMVARHGQLQESLAPFISSFQGRGVHREVQFHALTETPAADPAPLCQRVSAAFRRSLLSQDRLSLTTAMSRALQEGHQELLKANETEPLANRVGAGVTCLALRDTEVYMAQAGPGVLYLRDAHGVRTLHPLAPDAPQDEEGKQGPHLLGMAPGELPVMLDRLTLEEGQVLLVASSSLASSVSYDGLVAILSASPQEATGKLHMLMQEDPLFAALLVSFQR